MLIGLVRGLWLLLFPGYWAITGSALGYHIAALCHRDPVALDLQVWPHPMLQQLIDLVGVGVGQLVDQVLDLVSLPAFLHHQYLGELSSTALDRTLDAADSKEWSHFCYLYPQVQPTLTHTATASSTVLPSHLVKSEPACPFSCPQGWPSYVF